MGLMRRGEPAEDSSLEWFDAAPAAIGAGDRDVVSGPRRPGRALAVVAVLGVSVAVGVFATNDHSHRAGSGSAAPTIATVATTSTTDDGKTPRARALAPGALRPYLEFVGHPFLPEPVQADAVVLTDEGLARYNLDAGQIVRTPIERASTAPYFVLVNGTDVVVRPYDNVPGYAVTDDGVRRSLTGRLASGTFGLFPAADADHAWVLESVATQEVVQRVTLGGVPAGDPLTLPHDVYVRAADGAGGMLAWGSGGTFVIGTGGMKQIDSAGTVVATGPLTFIFRECTGSKCSLVSIDRTSGRRQTIGPAPERDAEAPIGMVSPDGRRVALVEGAADSTELHLLDLATGDDEVVGSVEGWTSLTPTAAWSPDGRWLVYVDPDHGLVAREPSLARTVTIDATIHPRVVLVRRTPVTTTAP
jgi:hypothetical protein